MGAFIATLTVILSIAGAILIAYKAMEAERKARLRPVRQEVPRTVDAALPSNVQRPLAPNVKPYLDDVSDLIRNLTQSLPLPEWAEGLSGYTPEEAEAIRVSQADYAIVAEYILKEASAGISPGQGIVNPVYAEPVKRLLAVRRLKQLADGAWRNQDAALLDYQGDKAPENWKGIVSTYLKIWMASSNPFDILDVAELLVLAGRWDESKAAIDAALMFPAHAVLHPAPKEEFFAVMFLHANMYFLAPSEQPWSRAYKGIMEGNYSAENLAALRQRARKITAQCSGAAKLSH